MCKFKIGKKTYINNQSCSLEQCMTLVKISLYCILKSLVYL